MKTSITFLLVVLSAVATPAAAEWTFIGKSTIDDQHFIDLTTLRKGARPRAWFMTNYSERVRTGDLSNKMLYEADCREEKIKILAARFYTQPMGEGAPNGIVDQPSEWGYVTPNTMEAEIARILCRGNR